jgi:predicted RNase H-like nuclease (RuvC/YqgF family)
MTRNNIIRMIDLESISIKPNRPTPKRTRKQKIGKREVLRRLSQENTELKRTITSLNQQISIVEAENTVLANQLAFFTEQMNKNLTNPSPGHPPQAAPVVDPPDPVDVWDNHP